MRYPFMLLLLSAGCLDVDDIDTGTDESEIQGGVSEPGYQAVGLIELPLGAFCTGNLISPSWVMTAGHCAGVLSFKTGTNDSNFVTHAVVAGSEIAHPSRDIRLVKLQTPIFDIAPLVLATAPPYGGADCLGVGFGRHMETDGTTTVRKKRSGSEHIISISSTDISVNMVTGLADKGDSGGPLICYGSAPGAISAIVHGHDDGDWPAHKIEHYPPIDRAWTLANTDTSPSVLHSSGILWRASAGDLAIWHDANAGWTTMPGGADSTWKVAGVGDFNGNGISDILWRSNTGANTVWLDGVANGYALSPVGTDWKVAGIGDFNGNGKADILWRSVAGDNVIWPEGNAPGYWLDAAPNIWSVVGIGDFNFDLHADILWRDTAGDNVIWYSGVGPGTWISPMATNFKVAGVGDFNGDGRSDILWRNSTAGTQIWPSGNAAAAYALGTLDNSWSVAGVGDFDRDYKADILWRKNTGVTALWMHGDVAHTVWPGPLDNTWQIQGVGRFD